MGFGEKLSELRKDYGLKQKDIATLLNVAVSTVSNYETDSHEPDLENLCKLADLFHVSTDYLLGRTDIKLELNALKDTIHGAVTKEDILKMMEQFSKEDCMYLIKTLRLLYYYSTRKENHTKVTDALK